MSQPTRFASISDVKEAVSAQFAPFLLDLEDGLNPVEMRNVIQLDSATREKFTSALTNASHSAEGTDIAELEEGLFAALPLVISRRPDRERLLEAIDGNLGFAIKILELYMGATDTPEA